MLTDHASDLLLCSTDTAVRNLEREAAAGEVRLVGDAMADVTLAFAPVAERLEWSALFIGVSFLLACGIAWMLSGRIVQPLRRLGKDAAIFAAGDLSHRTDLRSADECGQLAQSFNDMALSIEAGQPVPVVEPAPPTRCDALQTKLVSPLTVGALKAQGARGISVNEEEIERAMAFAARNLRLVAEPGGAVALAALLAGKAGPVSEQTVVVISGGNVDPLLYAQILERQAQL